MKEILNSYFLGILSEKEKSDLFDKMEADQVLKKEFVELQNKYALAQMLNEEQDDAYAESHLSDLKRLKQRKPFSRKLFTYSKYAAILLIAIGIFGIFKYYSSDSDHLDQDIQYTEYTAPVGLRQEIILPDGTQVFLAPSSKIKVPVEFAKDVRQVILDGEALFDVQSDKKRPFIVETKMYNVEVLGTIFLVNAYSEENAFKTSLIEGSVSVYNETENILLKPDETALFVDNQLEIVTNDEDEIYYLQSGIYNFENRPLGEIINILEKWYGTDVNVSDDELYGKILTGKFREDGNIDAILNAIQRIHPFTYNKSSTNEINIYKQP